jgi:tetratricopeptide (TPR) repeat protein
VADDRVSPAREELGRLLRAHRQRVRYYQRSLGARIGCSDSELSKVEHGKRIPPRAFWSRAGEVCDDGGELVAAYDALVAAERDAKARRQVQTAHATLKQLQASASGDDGTAPMVAPTGIDPKLAEVLLRTLGDLVPRYGRRTVLQAIQWATASVTGVELVTWCQWLARVVDDPGRVDGETIAYLRQALRDARRRGEERGPGAMLATVQGLRDLVHDLLTGCPPRWRAALLCHYSDVACAVGKCYVDLGQYQSAKASFYQARKAAYEAGGFDLGAYALANLSFIEYLLRRSCEARDLAAAARNEAARSGDRHMIALCYQMTAAAHALCGSEKACHAAYDRARASVQDAPPPCWDSPVYWLHSATIESAYCSDLALMGSGEPAVAVAQGALDSFDPQFRVGYARCLTRSGVALTSVEEIDEAARRLSEAVDIAATVASSLRLVTELHTACTALGKWRRRKTVRELNAQVTESGLWLARSASLT